MTVGFWRLDWEARVACNLGWPRICQYDPVATKHIPAASANLSPPIFDQASDIEHVTQFFGNRHLSLHLSHPHPHTHPMFTWIPIHEEAAKRLLDYKDRSDELVSILNRMSGQGLPTTKLTDQGKDGERTSSRRSTPSPSWRTSTAAPAMRTAGSFGGP